MRPTTDFDNLVDEGVSAPYRPTARPMARPMPSTMPHITLRADWFEHETVRAAGVLATWMWLCAVGEVRRRGGPPFLTLSDLRRLMDVEELGVKARPIIARGIDAGLFASTKGGVIVLTEMLDERR
jgi:hypothetical protein